MKKKQPTLTHYTKRLKKVRLARTITVIATLFVSGVVVAANVLPQVVKSNASKVPDTTNDVINGGVDQYNGVNAKSQLVAKVINGTTPEAKSAKALYAKFGIGEAEINGAKFEWLYGPNATKSVTPNEPINGLAPKNYGDWYSFGRNQNVDPNGLRYTLLQVAYGSAVADFYYKPFKAMHPGTWDQGKSAEPVLMGNGWFIVLECGNIVVPSIPTNPTINFTKTVVSVKRGTTTLSNIDPATFKLQLNDQIKYNLHGKNGDVIYPTGLRLADAIPTGTEFVSQGEDGWAGGVKVTNVSPKPVVDGKTYVAWDFSEIPAKQQGDTDFTVKVTSVASQICNSAIWSKGAGQPLIGATSPLLCLGVGKPVLTVDKVIQNGPTSVKVGDQLSYKIIMKNTGTVAAPSAVALDILKKNAAGGVKSEAFVSLGAPALTNTSDGAAISLATNAYHAVKDSASQATYANGNADAYGYQLESMPAGSTLTFTITTKAIVLPEACNFAIANFKDSGNSIAVATSTPPCVPVIDVTKPHVVVTKTSPTTNRNVARGQTINYSIVVENTSTQAATTSDVTVTDTFSPAGSLKNLKETGHTTTPGAAVTSSSPITNGLSWKVTKLPARGKVTINISAVVVDTAADATRICNNAIITMTPPNTVVSETSSTVCNTVSLIKPSKTASYVDRGDNPQQSPANAGDKIKYTLTTTNQASSVASKYIVVEDVADVMSYANIDIASTGGATLTGTKLTWPAKDIPAGGSIANSFVVTVKDPVPNNEPSTSNPSNFDYNMFNNYGNDVNIKINKPLIQRVVDVATNLPETGAAQYGLVIFFLGMSVYFFVRNKQLTSELAAATVEYQHQASTSSMSEAQNLIHPEDTDETTPEPPAQAPSI